MLAVLLAVVALFAGTHHRRHHHRRPPMQDAVASYYYDSGQTASGLHYTYGFASLLFGSRWGQRVLFCYRRCVVGRLDDHGPYVTGRLFDLNVALHDALGCPGLCDLRWRTIR